MLRLALRSLARRPVYSAICVTLLALGVASVSAILGLVDVALIRPLPYPDPDRLVWISAVQPGPKGPPQEAGLTPIQIVRWRDDNRTFDALEGALGKPLTYTNEGTPETISGLLVTSGLLHMLGGSPTLGRDFVRGDESPGGTSVIVSNAFWTSHLGADPSAIGRSIVIDGHTVTVIGVTPPGFSPFFTKTDVYAPLAIDATLMKSTYRGFQSVGRLKQRISEREAMADLRRSDDVIAAAVPQLANSHAKLLPLREALFGDSRTSLLMMLAATTLLLLIAMANVVNLMMSDALARRFATLTRLALGASPGQIIALRLAESALVALCAGVIGIGGGRIALAALSAINPDFFQGFGELGLGLRIAAVTIIGALVIGVLTALPAALSESRFAISSLAGGEGRGVGARRQWVREVLLSGQVALAIVLLFAAALLTKNLRAVLTSPKGFEPTGLMAIKMPMPSRYVTPEERATFLTRTVDAVSHVPGVRAATASQSFFAVGSSSRTFLAIQGLPMPDSSGYTTQIRHVMPDFAAVAGGRVVEGRDIGAGDREGSTLVAVVNRSFAHAFLNDHAIGARMRRTALPGEVWMTVVGVVDEIKDAGVGVDLGPTIYIPFLQENQASVTMTILARLAGPTMPTPQSVKRAIWSVDPAASINRVALVDDLLVESASVPRFQSLLVALLSIGALLLVTGGIYALTLYAVLQRRREIGVRAALGATPAQLVTHGVWLGLRPVMVGSIAGLVIAFPAVRAMQRLLSQTFGAGDIVQLAIVIAMLAAATALAAFLPARRATRISPLVAMRG